MEGRLVAVNGGVLTNMAREQWLLSGGLVDRTLSHWARAPLLDEGGDDDTDEGTDTTISDDDDIAFSAYETTNADVDYL